MSENTPQNLGKEAIGEENTAKLLARAYRPELPEEDFVRRTKEAMRGVRVAEGSHRIGGAAWARWWLAAAVLAAGAGFYWAVGLSREGVYQQEGGAVVIGGVRYVPESNTRPPVPVGEGTGVRVPETVMAATNGVGATTGTAVVEGGGTKAGGVTSAPIVVASGKGATTRVPLVVTSGVGATTSAPLAVASAEGITTSVPAAVAESGGKMTARAAGSRPATEVVTEGQTITTAAGQRRRVGLADGTVVYINEKTALHIDGARQVRLDSGVAYFEVARRQGAARVQDPTFLVKTPTRQVAALGTHFAVDVKEAGTGIVVTQGRVDVEGMEVYAGEELPAAKDAPKVQAPRVSVALDWIRDLVAAAQSPLVPASDYCGGALVVVDPSGQESRLTLRNYAIDVNIEDGFARTTIDQTYFNDSTARMEGTFYFPLPADGSLSRLAMYVDGTLMEGGMCEREAAREVYETILYQRRDPALLEWVDGSTFKMRVFPIEGRQEKRVLLSYTQKLESLYGQMKYRFPAGHSMSVVRDWAFKATVKNAAGNWWSSESHPLNALEEGKDLVLTVTDRQVKPDRDVTLNLGKVAGPPPRSENQARFAAATSDGQRYLMVRAQPALSAVPRRQRRDWVFLFEASGARDPVVARAQIEIIRSLLDNAEHDDTFAIVTAGAHASAMGDALPATAENVAKAVDYLAQTHLVGALDLGQALDATKPLVVAGKNPYLVHVGTGISVLGERSADELVKRIPAGAKYVGVAVGKSWSRQFMKAAAGRTNGYFTQINPDESVAWRAFELLATLNTPRLLNVRVIDPSEKLTFLNFGEALAQGEEFCAIARYAVNSVAPSNLVLTGTLDGAPYRQELVVREVAENAGYLPRMWAKLEIDRLLAENSSGNKAAIIGLSKDMYVMSPYTSLLVLENEAMYAQYKVDRGRKDHWAMYAAPGKIPVVTEAGPLVMAQTRPAGQKLSAEGTLGSVLVRVGSPVVTWPNATVTNGTGGTMSVREYVARVNGNARGRLGMDFYGEVENSEFNTLEGLKLRPQMNSWENLWFEGAGNSNDLFSWGLMPQVAMSGGGGLARTGPAMVSIGLLGGSDFGLGGAKTFAGSTVINGTALLDTSGQVVGINITNPGVGYMYSGTRVPMGGGFGGFGVGGASGVDGTALLGGKDSQLQLMPGLVENISGIRAPISGPVTSFGGRTVGSGGMYYRELNLTGGMLRTVTGKGRESGFNSLDFNGGYLSMNGGSVTFTSGGLVTLNGIAGRGVSMNAYSTGGFAGGGGVPQYQRPTYSNDWRVFGDLLSYAPGMNTSLADVRTVLESETDVDPAMAAGTIEPAARALIERARRTGWQSVTISQGPGQGALTIRVDGQGRYRYERRVSEGLRETVVCDGTTLLQLYPDIGVGARRAVSRFHREELTALVPWVVPPAEDLARGCSVAVVTGRTVQITPKGAAERKDAEGKALAYVVLQMIFGESGRLVERRWVEMPTNKVVGFETYSAAGEVRTCDGTGKELGKVDLAAKEAAGPVLSAETDSLVVLPLPIRGRDRVVPADERARSGALGWTNEWTEEKALALIAADVGSNPTEVPKVIAERFFARGDRRIGFYTLLMASGMNMNEETTLVVGGGKQVRFNPLADHPGSDLARYCVDLWHARQEGVYADILFKGDGKGDFVARMAAIRASIVRMLAGGMEGERANATGLLATCKDPGLAWALYAMATHYGGGTDFYHALAEATKSVSEAPALGYAARFEEAWGLYGTNTAANMEAARGKFVELYKETVDAGMLPAINAEFMSAVRHGNGETWQKVLRETSGRVREKQGRVAAMAQAWQCWQMGDQGMANELFEKAMADVPAEERLAATVAGVNYLCNAGQYLRALKMVEPLLEDGRLNGSPGLWRVAAALAFNQRMLAQGLKYQERAMDLEFANMPAVVNVQGLRQEYSQALWQYQQMASAMALLGQAPPAELITRVIRTADRWRAIDPEKAGACQAAARVFAAMNVPELAWDYVTTPLAEKFNEAAPWAGLAQQLQQHGDLARADAAYATAFEVEPTNAQMLWDRATLLQQMNRMLEARALMQKLAEGKWEPRFASLQSQAKSYLQTR